MASTDSRRAMFVSQLVTGRTINEAAAAAGVSQRTGARWHAESEVQTELVRMRRATLNHARKRRLGLVDGAADTLAEVMAGSLTDSARVSAARTVIAQALRLDERVELEGRLVHLEQIIETQQAARRRWT